MNFRNTRAGALTVVALALVVPATGQEQIVVPDPISQPATPGGAAVSFTLVYDTSDGLETQGLGVRMFFDSGQLAYMDLTNVLTEDAIGLSAPENDLADEDSDALTDMFVTIAWVNLPGEWADGPKDLFDANFTTTAGFGSTTVRFTGFTSAGYTFASTPFTVVLGAPAPTLTLTPSVTPTPSQTPTQSSTPTATPTPSPTFSPTPTTSPTPSATQSPSPTPTPSSTPSPFALLDIDRDGAVSALTDGLLVLRYLFGIRDDVLISSATGIDCTVCAADDIEAYIESIRAQLDADGDGEVEPLTDGLLILRYLFGFRDAVLIEGVVDADCTRCTADEIEVFLEAYL